jgi:hypothetical protein
MKLSKLHALIQSGMIYVLIVLIVHNMCTMSILSISLIQMDKSLFEQNLAMQVRGRTSFDEISIERLELFQFLTLDQTRIYFPSIELLKKSPRSNRYRPTIIWALEDWQHELLVNTHQPGLPRSPYETHPSGSFEQAWALVTRTRMSFPVLLMKLNSLINIKM